MTNENHAHACFLTKSRRRYMTNSKLFVNYLCSELNGSKKFLKIFIMKIVK